MPRIRTIKPEITTDEKLARVSRDARLTFFYCISQADDDGLLPGNPRQLLAALFPMDQSVTDRILAYWVKELVDIGICRWRETKQGAPVLEIAKWSDHQRIDHKGKSLLAPNLKPFHEDGTSDSRDPRDILARPSRSDLGPRTMDHGPTTVDRLPAGAGDGESIKRVARIPNPDVETVVAHYVQRHPKRRPSEKDRTLIAKHLRTYSPGELAEAIDGNAGDAWAVEKRKHELAWILRDNGQVDTYRAKAEQQREPLVDANGLPTERGMRILAGRV